MNTPNQSEPLDNLGAVLKIICEIAEKSVEGNYLYRGEPQRHRTVSSSLWRVCRKKMRTEYFDIQAIEAQILEEVRKFTSEKGEIEIWAELQHYGGHTNLIDFTTDSHIALFFACDRFLDKPGRVILLGEKAQNENRVERTLENPRHRIIAQKSVFIHPPTGLVEPDDVITVPAHLKLAILRYLEKHHGISTETIYNDLHGFIRNQNIYQTSCIEVYMMGLPHEQKGDPDNEDTDQT